MQGLERVGVFGGLSSPSSSALVVASFAGFFGAGGIELSEVPLVGDRKVVVDFLVILSSSSSIVSLHPSLPSFDIILSINVRSNLCALMSCRLAIVENSSLVSGII
jgi:hypothetical protein